MRKSREDILKELLVRLEQDTVITDTNPGSVARTFVEVLTEQFYQVYNQLELNSTMSFVSTATGRYLDLVGSLLDCKRTLGESDANYRARITQQVYVVAGANYTSIRLKALSINGVRDVVMKQYTHGAGSFTIHVITDNPVTPVSILNEVKAIVGKTKAYGVYADIKSPVLIPMELMVRLVFSNDIGSSEKASIRQSVVRATKEYVDGLILGEAFIVNEAIQRIMGISDKIKDIDIYSLKVNGASRFVSNVSTRWDERLVLDKLEII